MHLVRAAGSLYLRRDNHCGYTTFIPSSAFPVGPSKTDPPMSSRSTPTGSATQQNHGGIEQPPRLYSTGILAPGARRSVQGSSRYGDGTLVVNAQPSVVQHVDWQTVRSVPTMYSTASGSGQNRRAEAGRSQQHPVCIPPAYQRYPSHPGNSQSSHLCGVLQNAHTSVHPPPVAAHGSVQHRANGSQGPLDVGREGSLPAPLPEHGYVARSGDPSISSDFGNSTYGRAIAASYDLTPPFVSRLETLAKKYEVPMNKFATMTEEIFGAIFQTLLPHPIRPRDPNDEDDSQDPAHPMHASAVVVRNFGRFELAKRKPRKILHIKSRQLVELEEHQALVFRPSTFVKHVLKNRGGRRYATKVDPRSEYAARSTGKRQRYTSSESASLCNSTVAGDEFDIHDPDTDAGESEEE